VTSRTPASAGTRAAWLWLWLCLSGASAADALVVGRPLPEIGFVDQFDATHALGNCDWLLFAPDRRSSDIARDLLSDPDRVDMSRQRLCHVADISTMPAVITKLVAVPAMRDYPHPVLLDHAGTLTAGWPRQPGHLTVLDVREGRIASVDFAASVDEAIGLLPLPYR
jgi:hypothetical protein